MRFIKFCSWVLLFVLGTYLVANQVTPILIVEYGRSPYFLRITEPSIFFKALLGFFYLPLFVGWHKSWHTVNHQFNGNGKFRRRLWAIFCFNFLIAMIVCLFLYFVPSNVFSHRENATSVVRKYPISTVAPTSTTESKQADEYSYDDYQSKLVQAYEATLSGYSSSCEQLYRTKYPETWAYIKKHADDPAEYIKTYHAIWGDLQEYHGDGIPFDTLTPYEQSLVNYPDIGTYVYFVKLGSTYHSTPDCYTLLRSEVSIRLSEFAYKYAPCSKCVGE